MAQCLLYSTMLFNTFRTSAAYCWEPGMNPYFGQAPRVEQVNLSTVRISWKDAVEKRWCVDHFLVKYWQTNMPTGYKLTELVTPDVNFIEVEVVPKVPYNFMAVAREDKGPVMGIDWNKSPIVKFKTSRLNHQVEVPPPSPEIDVSTRQPPPSTSTTHSPLVERGEPGVVFQGITVELLAIIVVSGFIVILIIISLVYKCLRTKSVLDSTDLDEEEDDDATGVEGGGIDAELGGVAAGRGVAIKVYSAEDDDDDDDDEDEDYSVETDKLRANSPDL